MAVVGGGDTAITEALHLAKFASKITIIHRRNQLRAAHVLQEKITVRTENRFSLGYDGFRYRRHGYGGKNQAA